MTFNHLGLLGNKLKGLSTTPVTDLGVYINGDTGPIDILSAYYSVISLFDDEL